MDWPQQPYEVHDPASLGLDPGRVAELVARARREVDAGLLPSCQIALARHGRLALFDTIGDADPTSRYVMFSCTKGFTAGAVWLLVGEGRLDWDTRAADVVAEFGTNGKDAITVEQLLTHTSGFPQAPMSPERAADPATRREQLARWRCNWEPGTRFEYHPTSAHWVLGEIVREVTGEDLGSFVRARITGPLGLDRFELGAPPDHQGDVNELVTVGEPPTPAELEAILGVPLDLADFLGEVTQDALLQFNRPEVRAIGFPGAGGIATAADLALYYQAVAGNALELWDPAVLAEATTSRVDLPDPVLGYPAHRSLGLQVAGDPPDAQLRGFGHGLSPRTYGHDGAGGQIACVDPDSGLSIGYLTNGLDANPIRDGRRKIGIASRAAACIAAP
ncbi:MAG: serine hydrolase domain-containing protein [Acidimicrobiales bacterium]